MEVVFSLLSTCLPAVRQATRYLQFKAIIRSNYEDKC